MIGEHEIGIIACCLTSYRRSRLRLLRLEGIGQADSQRYEELIDTENYIWAMPLEAKELGKAVLVVSKSRVWSLISTYLRGARLTPPIPRPSFRATHRAIVKLRAKRRQNFLTRYELKGSMRDDVKRMRNWLQWAWGKWPPSQRPLSFAS